MRNLTKLDKLLERAKMEAPLNYKGQAIKETPKKNILKASLIITALVWLPISLFTVGFSLLGLVILPSLFLGSTLLTGFNINRHVAIRQTKSRLSLSNLMDAVEQKNFYLTDSKDLRLLAEVIELFEATRSYQSATLKMKTIPFCDSHATALSRAILTKTLANHAKADLSLLKFAA